MKNLTAQQIEAAFAAEVKPRTKGICRLGVILKEHPELENRVMDVATYDGSTVSRVLKALDLPVSREVVARHRKGFCSCTGKDKAHGSR